MISNRSTRRSIARIPLSVGTLCAVCLCTLVLSSLGLGGCTSAQKPVKSEYTNAAEYAFDYADFQFAKKDWDYARSLFEKVQQEYPYSLYARKAELRVADTYFKEKTFIRAAAAYRRFIQLHPAHDDVDYAAFRIVKSYNELMPNSAFFMPPTWERDRRDSVNSYQAARQFMRSYPDSEYVEDVSQLLEDAADRLANYELYVAQYYMNKRHRSPIASIRRAQSMIDKYPESSLVPSALALQVEAALAIDNADRAATALESLETDYPNSDEFQKAQQMMGDYQPSTAQGSDADETSDDG